MGEKMTLEQVRDRLRSWYGGSEACLDARNVELLGSMIAALDFHLTQPAQAVDVERLQKIEKERWDVVATRNAAVMRAERAEALLREVAALIHPDTDEHKRITAHLSENSHD